MAAVMVEMVEMAVMMVDSVAEMVEDSVAEMGQSKYLANRIYLGTTRADRAGDGVGAREFRLKRSRAENISVCAVVAAVPVHEGNVLVERRSGTKHISYQSLALCSNSQCLG